MKTIANSNLLRSDHYVLAYYVQPATNWILKAEVYHQEINNAAVDALTSSNSTLIESGDFVFADNKTSHVNEGTDSIEVSS